MPPLDQELQKTKQSIFEFRDLTIKLIQHLPNVITDKQIKGDYVIQVSNIAGNKKYVRPFNQKLIIQSEPKFSDSYNEFIAILESLRTKKYNYNDKDGYIIDSVVYTMQQMIGAGLDLFVGQNSARKHVDNKFEELIKAIIDNLNIQSKKVTLQIPYDTDECIKT